MWFHIARMQFWPTHSSRRLPMFVMWTVKSTHKALVPPRRKLKPTVPESLSTSSWGLIKKMLMRMVGFYYEFFFWFQIIIFLAYMNWSKFIMKYLLYRNRFTKKYCNLLKRVRMNGYFSLGWVVLGWKMHVSKMFVFFKD